jgi:uncharacterized membrane protein YqaE (UPF0057 family)
VMLGEPLPMIIIAVLMPFLALLLDGHVLQAAFCLGLQLTLIGWIPAAIWAVVAVKRTAHDRRYQELVAKVRR